MGKNKYLKTLNKLIDNKWAILFLYGILLLVQYYIIFAITWTISSIYLVSLTFSLLLLFFLFTWIITSILFSVIFIVLIIIQNSSSIMVWVMSWITTVCILGIIYAIIYFFSEKHYKKVFKATDSFFKFYFYFVGALWFIIFLYFFMTFFKDLLENPRSVYIERQVWVIEEYKLRFYNMDHYFLETSSWSIKILDNSQVKSLEFKK
jgi:hypothetical protein